MDAESVMADLSDPDPMKTVKDRKKAPEPPKPEPSKAEEPPPKPEAETDPLEGDEPPKPTEPKAEDTPPPPDKPMTDEKGKPIDPKKVSPWKLLDQFKGRLTAAEKENIELKERLAKVPDISKLEGIEKRNAELEEEIRYHNFAKSEEFAKNYQKPYEEAWAAAASELAELDVIGEDGAPTRKATPNDLLALANLPLGEARKQANAMFGDSADDVMAHRRKIQEMSKAQAKALEDARKVGSERVQKASAQQEAVAREITEVWTRANAEVASKLDILKPKEGDDEWNTKLAGATKLAEEAFSRNAADPSLTPEQRADIVRKHVAMRNRAIAYSPLMLEVKRLRAQLAERDNKLKAFENTEPNGGNGSATDKAQTAQAATPMERSRQRLREIAVPTPSGYY